MSNFIGGVRSILQSAVILEREGVQTWNLPVFLVFMCIMTSINDKEFWDGGLKNPKFWLILILNYSTAIILTVHYISTIWYNRCKNAEINSSLFKANIINHQKLLSLILKEKLQNVFTENYCYINTWI